MDTQIHISLRAIPWWLILLQAILSIFIGIVILSAPGTAMLVIVRLLDLYWLLRCGSTSVPHDAMRADCASRPFHRRPRHLLPFRMFDSGFAICQGASGAFSGSPPDSRYRKNPRRRCRGRHDEGAMARLAMGDPARLEKSNGEEVWVYVRQTFLDVGPGEDPGSPYGSGPNDQRNFTETASLGPRPSVNEVTGIFFRGDVATHAQITRERP